jgi:hypothetical protein
VRHLHLRRSTHVQSEGTLPPVEPVEEVLTLPSEEEVRPPSEEAEPAPTPGDR